MNRSTASDESRRGAALILDALAAGSWIALTDACVAADGRASIAWGVFSPSGLLATCGARVLPGLGRSSTDAECLACSEAGNELARMSAGRSSSFCDCLPATQVLLGAAPAKTPAALEALAAWEACSPSSTHRSLAWVPRDLAGPANDAARKILGLPPQQRLKRPWSGWLENLRLLALR